MYQAGLKFFNRLIHHSACLFQKLQRFIVSLEFLLRSYLTSLMGLYRMAFEFQNVQFNLTKWVHKEADMTITVLQLAAQFDMCVRILVQIEVFNLIESVQYF